MVIKIRLIYNKNWFLYGFFLTLGPSPPLLRTDSTVRPNVDPSHLFISRPQFPMREEGQTIIPKNK